MLELLRYGPPGSEGSPEAGPGSPDGPFGPGADPGGGSAVTVTGLGTGDPPLCQIVPQFDPVRVTQATQLLARFYNSLVYHGVVKLLAGETPDRQFVIDPAASPLWPGGGLTVTADSPGTYGSYS